MNDNAGDRSPHGFLLYLRARHPALARRFESFTTLGHTEGALRAKLDHTGWPGAELMALAEQGKPFAEAVRAFFGPESAVELEPAASDPERLPFPVTSTKYWNHVAFIVGAEESSALVALPKPVYAELLKEGAAAEEFVAHEKVLTMRVDEPRLAAALLHFIDPLAALARELRSYVHFLTPFPGDAEATALEARLYSMKEWGTPSTPYEIARKFLGRLHYCDPDAPPLGARIALELAQKKLQ